MNIAGIDWSMTSPAICVADVGLPFRYKDCKIHFFSKKADNTLQLFPHDPIAKWSSQEERFHWYSNWALDVLWQYDVQSVAIEGYAFGSTSGLVFNIGESTGALKQILWKKAIGFEVVPPTVVKKFATTKGNANKDLLRAEFEKQTGYKKLKEMLHETEKQHNPSSDIIDSFFIAKWLWVQENT